MTLLSRDIQHLDPQLIIVITRKGGNYPFDLHYHLKPPVPPVLSLSHGVSLSNFTKIRQSAIELLVIQQFVVLDEFVNL